MKENQVNSKIGNLKQKLSLLIKTQQKERQPSRFSYIMIFLSTILMMLGPISMSDIPQLYEDIIIRKFGKTSIDVESLYAIFSLPNLIMTPLGSLLLSYTGLGLGSVIFQSLVVIGAFMIYYGFYSVQFAYLFWGRAVYGLGCEVAIIISATVADKWFSGKMLSITQGLGRTVAFTGQFIGAFFGPELFIKSRAMYWTLMIYVATSYVSFLMATIYFFIERSQEKKLISRNSLYEHEKQCLINQIKDMDMDIESIRTETSISNIVDIADIDLKDEQDTKQSDEEYEENQNPKFAFKDIKNLSPLFWISSLCFALGSMCFIQFLGFSTDCLVNRYGYTFKDAKNVIASLPVCAIIFGPMISALITKIGKKPFIFCLAAILEIGIFLTLRNQPPKPSNLVHILFLGQGIFYSTFVAIIWPSMTLTVPKSATAAALGFATTIQNLFITILAYYFGYVNEERSVKSYNNSLYSMAVISIVTLGLGILMTILDFKKGKLLTLPENDKRVMIMRRNMQKQYNKMTKDRAINQYKSLKSNQENESYKPVQEEVNIPNYQTMGSFKPIQEENIKN